MRESDEEGPSLIEIVVLHTRRDALPASGHRVAVNRLETQLEKAPLVVHVADREDDGVATGNACDAEVKPGPVVLGPACQRRVWQRVLRDV